MAQEKLQKRYHKADVFLGLLSGKPAFLTGEKNSLTLCKWIWFNAYSLVGFLTKKSNAFNSFSGDYRISYYIPINFPEH